MLRLAIAGNPHFEVSAMELERDGPSYTLVTVREMAGSLGPGCELQLIVGSDSLHDLPNWWHADELVREVRVLCLERPGFPLECLDELEARFGSQAVATIREGIVKAPLLDISSSDIRRRIAQGRSIRYLVPDPVREYIAAQGLYRR
jgi:nicotinate-nucleotide adenylyltransferase